jgi:hypothetical protein
MASGVKIEGTDELRDLANRLREAGDRKTLNALRKAIRDAAAPAVQDVATAVTSLAISGEKGARGVGRARITGTGGSGRTRRLTYDVLRSKGQLTRVLERAHARSGLRATVARALTTQIGASGRSASARIKVAQSKMPPDQRKLPYWMEKGHWRHPVFGGSRWVGQNSTPDWFHGTLRGHRDNVREAIRREIQQVTESI